jgi:hypothetical protein
VGIIYGVLVELATIRQLHTYQYGQFLIMVLDVPLSLMPAACLTGCDQYWMVYWH